MYEFWGDAICDAVVEDVRSMAPTEGRFVVNVLVEVAGRFDLITRFYGYVVPSKVRRLLGSGAISDSGLSTGSDDSTSMLESDGSKPSSLPA